MVEELLNYFHDLIIRLLMFTAEKSKLFFNDPKFLDIQEWDADSQEAAVNKIFAGQRQLRRSKVAYKTIVNRNEQQTPNPYLLLDFLQSRMNAFEDRMVSNVEQMFLEKQRIKDKYSEAEDLYEKANRKLKRLMVNVKTEKINFGDIEEVETEVLQIQRIYEENQFLKNMNEEIRKRIEKKQVQLGSLRK